MYFRKFVKETGFLGLTLLGIPNLFMRINQGKVSILMYHGVVKESLDPFCWTQIERKQFNRHIQYLKKHYQILRLVDVIEYIEHNRTLPENTAVLTFDDGLKNNFTVAYPILKQFNVPATIFLATGCVSKRSLCWPDRLYVYLKYTKEEYVDLNDRGLGFYPITTRKEKEKAFDEIVSRLKYISVKEKDGILAELPARLRVNPDIMEEAFEPLTWKEIKMMHQEGLIDFGGHTVNHNILTNLDEEEMESEIVESCRRIATEIGNGNQLFAYPNGGKKDFNENTKQILRKHQILCGLSTLPALYHPGGDYHEIPRLPIGSDISFARFKCLLSGALTSFNRLEA